MTERRMQQLRANLFGEEGPKPDLLLDLAPVLPESLLPRAIELARAIVDPSLRARVLQALAARLPEADHERLLDDARTAAQAIGDDHDRARALMDLAPHVPAAERGSVLAEARDTARAVPPMVRAAGRRGCGTLRVG